MTHLSFRAALTIIAFILVLAEVSLGNDPLSEISKELDEIELELKRREQLIAIAKPIHARFVDELKSEYATVSSEIQLMQQQDLEVAYAKLRNEKKSILLKLWHLDRLEPMLWEVDEKYNSLTSRLRTLKRNQRRALADPSIARRFEMISSSVQAIERERLTRRMSTDRGFYDMSDELERFTKDASATDPDARLPGNANAEEDNSEEDDADAPLNQLVTPIHRLIKLKWSDGQIVLDRGHWDALFPTGSLAAVAVAVDEELQFRGLKLSRAAHRSFLPEKRFQQREPSVSLLFQNLRHSVSELDRGEMESRTVPGRIGGVISNDAVEFSLQLVDNEFSLSIQEKLGAKRALNFESKPGALHLALTSSGDPIFDLSHQPTTGARILDIAGDPVELTGTTTADLYAKDPEYFEQTLFPRLQELGIGTPITRFDPKLIKLVLTKIRLADSRYGDELKRLLKQIDSPRFQQRTDATRHMTENSDVFAPLIFGLKNSADLPLDVRLRLDRITRRYEREFGVLESLSSKLKLTEDSEYLTKLLDISNPEQRTLIESQLARMQNASEDF